MLAWAYAAWFLLAISSLATAAWHQLTLHKGPYEYCRLWYLGLVVGVLGGIVMTAKLARVAPSFERFPRVARFCSASAGVCILGLGGVFAYLGLATLFPAWFSSGPVPVRRGGALWLVGLVFAVVLGAMGLAGIFWGVALLVAAVKGRGAASLLEAKPGATPRPADQNR